LTLRKDVRLGGKSPKDMTKGKSYDEVTKEVIQADVEPLAVVFPAVALVLRINLLFLDLTEGV